MKPLLKTQHFTHFHGHHWRNIRGISLYTLIQLRWAEQVKSCDPRCGEMLCFQTLLLQPQRGLCSSKLCRLQLLMLHQPGLAGFTPAGHVKAERKGRGPVHVLVADWSDISHCPALLLCIDLTLVWGRSGVGEGRGSHPLCGPHSGCESVSTWRQILRGKKTVFNRDVHSECTLKHIKYPELPGEQWTVNGNNIQRSYSVLCKLSHVLLYNSYKGLLAWSVTPEFMYH